MRRPQTVNFNTLSLGREGYLSLTWVTDAHRLPTYRPDANALLAALSFNAGKRYADFNQATESVALPRRRWACSRRWEFACV